MVFMSIDVYFAFPFIVISADRVRRRLRRDVPVFMKKFRQAGGIVARHHLEVVRGRRAA